MVSELCQGSGFYFHCRYFPFGVHIFRAYYNISYRHRYDHGTSLCIFEMRCDFDACEGWLGWRIFVDDGVDECRMGQKGEGPGE